MVENSIYLFFYYFFPDKHIDFWTTVEDGNLSQTFFIIIIIIIIWKYKYKSILSTSEMWESPIHFLSFFIILQQGLCKPYKKTWKMLSDACPFSQFSHICMCLFFFFRKSINVKKWASVKEWARQLSEVKQPTAEHYGNKVITL